MAGPVRKRRAIRRGRTRRSLRSSARPRRTLRLRSKRGKRRSRFRQGLRRGGRALLPRKPSVYSRGYEDGYRQGFDEGAARGLAEGTAVPEPEAQPA